MQLWNLGFERGVWAFRFYGAGGAYGWSWGVDPRPDLIG